MGCHILCLIQANWISLSKRLILFCCINFVWHFSDRTWHSLKERFRKRIMPRLHTYIQFGLSEASLQKFVHRISIKQEGTVIHKQIHQSLIYPNVSYPDCSMSLLWKSDRKPSIYICLYLLIDVQETEDSKCDKCCLTLPLSLHSSISLLAYPSSCLLPPLTNEFSVPY